MDKTDDPKDAELGDEEPATLPGMLYGKALLHPSGAWVPPNANDLAATGAAVETATAEAGQIAPGMTRKQIRASGGRGRYNRVGKEGAQALAAYAMYQNLPRLRRTQKLVADQIVKEEIAKGYTPVARYEARLRNVIRRVNMWATSFGWQKRAQEWDEDQEAQKRVKQESSTDAMNENQATIAGGLAAMSLSNVRALLEADAILIEQYTLDLKVWQRTMQQLSPAVRAGVDVPSRPSLFFGPTSLVNLAKTMLDTERIARGAATQIAQQQHTGGIDFVIQVKQQAQANSKALAQTPVGFPFAANKAIAGTDFAPPDGETVEPPEDGVVDAEVVDAEWVDADALDDGVDGVTDVARTTG